MLDSPSSPREDPTPARRRRGPRFWQGVIVGIVATLVVSAGSLVVLAQSDLRPRDWLRIAPDDTTRWQLLERMFGGFAPAMTQVAGHYQKTYDAISDGNLELARWQWDRVKTAIDLGLIRRPDRAPNAEAIFLNTAWPRLDEALADDDADAAREAFGAARNACMACHLAEERAYFNDQALFRDTATFPE
jgi:hypothetical protein